MVLRLTEGLLTNAGRHVRSGLYINAGSPIKAAIRGNGLLEGYLVAWGSPQDTDLEGQFFTPNTIFREDYYSDYPMLYHHGLDSKVGLDPIGRIKTIDKDDVGMWVQAQLDMADRYAREVYDMVQTRQFGWSSGSVDHLVKIAPDGEIQQWVLFEGSVTPTPAQPRKTAVSAVKSLYDPVAEYVRAHLARAVPRSDRFCVIEDGGETMASNATKRAVRAALRGTPYQLTAKEIEEIADQIEAKMDDLEDDQDAVMMDDLEDEDAVMMDDLEDEDAVMMDDLEDEDAVMMDDLEDDQDAVMMDDLEDDEDAVMMDDPEDDEDAVMTRASYGRKKRMARGRKAQSSRNVKRYIKQLTRRVKALERMEAPGERYVGMKALRVVDQADRKGAYKSALTKYLIRGEGVLTDTERYVLYSRQTRDSSNPGTVDARIKALNISNAASVGFAVTPDFLDEINRNISDGAPMVSEVRRQRTSSDTIIIPDLVTTDARRAFPGRVSWVGESPANQAASQIDEIQFAQINLPIWVALVSQPVTYSSLEDVSFNVESYLAEQFSEALLRDLQELIWRGDGQGKLRGIVNDARVTGAASTGVASVGGYVNSGNATSITSGDPLKTMQMHLPPQYRARAKWYASSETINIISQIKDGMSRYLWSDDGGLNQGIPSVLLGKPIVYNEWADGVSAGSFPLIYADMYSLYMLGERIEFSIRRFDDSSYAVRDQVLFIGRARLGGMVVKPYAAKVLRIAV